MRREKEWVWTFLRSKMADGYLRIFMYLLKQISYSTSGVALNPAASRVKYYLYLLLSATHKAATLRMESFK